MPNKDDYEDWYDRNQESLFDDDLTTYIEEHEGAFLSEYILKNYRRPEIKELYEVLLERFGRNDFMQKYCHERYDDYLADQEA